jgi:hypothetical protein
VPIIKTSRRDRVAEEAAGEALMMNKTTIHDTVVYNTREILKVL